VHPARLYLRYLGVSVRGQMQYRGSFLVLTFATLLNTLVEFVAIWALFQRFGSLRGWGLAEVALLFGLINIAFALGVAFGRGFDLFGRMVRDGDFDRLLLRPRSTALQVAGQELTLFRAGKLLQAVIVLVWAAGAMEVSWTAGRIALAAFTVCGGACLFVGLCVLQATLAFWTVDSLEVMNAFTDGGCETGQFPLAIYRPWFRKFFTFVVPLACVTYYPALAILGRADAATGSPLWFQCAAPATGVLFLLVSLRVWRFGVAHYRSTGS
jgi:ABC-2 type transport system permease protein